jgi:hypothetical protein
MTRMDFKLANMSGGLLPIAYIGFGTQMNLAGIMVTPRSATTSSRSVDTTIHGILHHYYLNKRANLYYKRCLDPVRRCCTDNMVLVWGIFHP